MTKEEQGDILNLSGDIEMRAVELAKAQRAAEDARQLLERSRHKLHDYTAMLLAKKVSA